MKSTVNNLDITEDNMSNRSIESATPKMSEEMSTASAVHNKTVQTIMPKSMVSDPRWFNRDRQNLKISRGEFTYSSRATKLLQQITRSLWY